MLCPFCKEEITDGAIKCKHCRSMLTQPLPQRSVSANIQIFSNENLIRKGGANLQRGIETVGRHLSLTNARLIFTAHAINIQSRPAEIPLSAIRSIQPCWTKFLNIIPIAPNSLAVRTDQAEYRFVLFGRSSWMQAIQSAISKFDT
jgi:hypothetical protein